MKNDDYKTEFEEHKKEIKVTGESTEEPAQSRVELHSKARKPKQQSKHKFINIFLGLFVLVPIIVLIIVFSNWMSPKETFEAEVDQEGIQFETNDELPEVEEVVDSATKKKQEEEQAKMLAEKEKKQREEEALAKKKEQEELTRKKEQEKIAQEEAYKREQEELKRKEEQRVAQEEAARKAAAEAKAKEEAAKASEPTGKTHTVKPGETLYRISVNYYGHGEGVNKIKQANGLSSNSISTGQNLIIP